MVGGTNLTLRYQHRKSIDIDLFTDGIVGISGFETIAKEIQEFYGDSVLGLGYPCKINDGYIFLRCFINKTKGNAIKVELLQNMKTLYPVEVIDDMRLIAERDIGLFKLESASARGGKKDVYDLDHITDNFPLTDLFDELKAKKNLFNKDGNKTIFDLDMDETPMENPLSLVHFDGALKANPGPCTQMVSLTSIKGADHGLPREYHGYKRSGDCVVV